ncbi:MAG: hypothetical protein A2283_16435 [Lentisphaerae bacterium RIFOXYA12_FULL_48_11]|nr:MAG: hypothetical protein A2283_16435 [Lentisphaerae bacterium RIFOXYA12_FULL_48_11]
MLKQLTLLCLTALAAVTVHAAELVIAESGKSDYQIVIPDKSEEAIVDNWLLMAAKLMQAAFEKNGFRIEIVEEGAKMKDKPGIYLGATGFTKRNGIKVEQHDDWTYYYKIVGKELIIAGNDRKDPINTIRGTKTPLALLGTVKGACDFLREYAGVRFLFMNMDQGMYSMRGDRWDAFNTDGSLKVDTRSIAFTPVEKIVVPEKLNLRKTPVMRANFDASHETFHYIAMNFFPPLSDMLGSNVSWDKAIPPAKYAKNHPEYFALTKEGKRACDLKLGFDSDMQYCVVNKGVQDLMYKEVEKLISNGEKTITISTLDAYQLCRCNCDECSSFFGIKAESWDQIHARGDSGRLWQAFFRITERVRKKYPEVKIVLLNYQDTPVSAKVIKKFPKNVIVKIQFASQLDFDRLQGVEFPAGICGFEETFTGFGQAGPYLPERTPEHIAEVVKAMASNNVKWSMRDGAMGYVRGMQAPAYYVYGRMMDDPSADWKAIHDEFCSAAFGNTAPQMKRFFDLLHMQIAIYSDFFGVFMPAWNRKYSRSTYHDSKWHVMSMYTPEYCADADSLLTSAEKAATDPDIKARLHLIRIEFDYIRKMSRIFFLQNAWTMNPSKANLDPLVDSIDDWYLDLEKLAGGTDRSTFKPLSDWPEMRPFNGHFYSHAALQNEGYQQQWNKTCLNWDTKAIRAGILTDKHQIKITTVEAAPGIDSNAWDTVSESSFKDRGGMPFANVKTTMKVLRDKHSLYVRIESLYPSKHPEDMFKKEPDGNIFTQEYVELGIMPPDAGGKIYRIAANPVEDSRYDSVFTPDKRNRLTEDVKWNGQWEFHFKTNVEKGPWTQPSRTWTAWFRIPFSDFGFKVPATGETWRFNAARNRVGRYMLWHDAQGVTDTKALGELVF